MGHLFFELSTNPTNLTNYWLQAGMERKDVMGKNVAIYKAQAAALEKHAKKDCKVGHLEL